MQRALIVDCYCEFLRHWKVNSTLNYNGDPIGGIVGFLKTISNCVKNTKPTKVFLIWDGIEGVNKRTQIYPLYKSDRRSPTKVQFFKEIEATTSDELENKRYQLKVLMTLLQFLPFKNIIIKTCEADDIIAHMCNTQPLKYINKVIVSTDSDLLQLTNEKTLILKPIKEEYITVQKVLTKYGVIPQNISIYKSFVGDRTDCIPGIESIGHAKFMLYNDVLKVQEMNVEQYVEYLKTNTDLAQTKILQTLINGSEKAKLYEKLVDLKNPMLNEEEKQYIDQCVNSGVRYDKLAFYKSCQANMISNFSYNWSDRFQYLFFTNPNLETINDYRVI